MRFKPLRWIGLLAPAMLFGGMGTIPNPPIPTELVVSPSKAIAPATYTELFYFEDMRSHRQVANITSEQITLPTKRPAGQPILRTTGRSQINWHGFTEFAFLARNI